MKKVLIDLLKLSNLNCGLGQVAINYAQELSKTETSFEKHFLVPKSFKSQFGDSIIYHTKRSIGKFLKANKFDLWHCIHQDPEIMPKDNTKVIMTIHDLNFLGEKNSNKAKDRLTKLQERVNNATEICFISEFSKKSALENLNLGNKKDHVIYNGVKILESDNQKTEDYKYFFSIGVLKRKKNFHVLISLMKFFPDCKLIIAGDKKGSYYKEMIKQIKAEKLSDQIIFPGLISEEEKARLYKNCSAFLFPSLFEGFGLPVIEAMRNGVPVFISNLSSLPEIGAEHAFYFDNFEAESMHNIIKSGINDFSIDTSRKQKQIAYSKEFSWEKNIKSYISLYNEML